MAGDASESHAAVTRRALLTVGAMSPVLAAMLVPDAALAAGPETWAQWTARMQRLSTSRTGVADPGASGRGECTHLWRDYVVKVVGAPWGAGHSGSYAHHLWTRFESDAEAKAAFTRVSIASQGRRGDGVVWAERFLPPAGHVAVLVDDLGDRVRVWGQNHGGNRFPELRVYSKQAIHGYLRPRAPVAPPPPPAPPAVPSIIEGDDMYIVRDATNGETYLLAAHGRIRLKTSAHVQLFQRMFDDRQAGSTSSFSASEINSIRWYLRNMK